MAIRKVAQLGNPVLRRRAEPVPPEKITSPEIQTLIDDLIETKEEYSGVGLAAPQVHESVQIAVIGMNGSDRYEEAAGIPLTVLVNPKIVRFSQEMDEDWEGCLSVADLWGRVKRAVTITLTAYDREGNEVEIEAEGFQARVFQHEIDHLYGKVFLDRMSDLSSLSFSKEYSKYGRLGQTEDDEE